ncbi:cell wall protein DAN4, partial [Biomphalaria pfeifferi]
MAYGQEIEMSSVAHGFCDNHIADGITHYNSTSEEGGCVRSNSYDLHPHVSLTFGYPVLLWRLVFYVARIVPDDTLRNFKITFYDTNLVPIHEYLEATSSFHEVYTLDLLISRPVKSLTLSLCKASEALSLCEIETYG